VAEGDTIVRAARRISEALAGETVGVVAPNPRGRITGVGRLDGEVLRDARARGKNLLFDFGALTLHSHLGMSGSWHLYRRGQRWAKPQGSAWAVIRGDGHEAVEWGGPTLRVLRSEQLRRDPKLARLGPDVLSPDFDPEEAIARIRRQDPGRELGDALLDQRLLAGIGNVFKSEACFAARLDPGLRLAELSDADLDVVIGAAREQMLAAVRSGRRPRGVYGRRGEPCRSCGTPIRSAGQGDSNRTTYWCPRCQAAAGERGPLGR
jgi:endonuclease VIII